MHNKLIAKITENILEKRNGLDNVPSVVISAIIERAIQTLQDALPTLSDGAYSCSVEDIFGDWNICECGALVQEDKIIYGEDCALCSPCAEDMKREYEAQKGNDIAPG